MTQAAHCVKSVQIRNFFWSVSSHIWTEYGDLRGKSQYSVRIRENTDQKKLRLWTLFTQWQSVAFLKTGHDFSQIFCIVILSKSGRWNEILPKLENAGELFNFSNSVELFNFFSSRYGNIVENVRNQILYSNIDFFQND